LIWGPKSQTSTSRSARVLWQEVRGKITWARNTYDYRWRSARCEALDVSSRRYCLCMREHRAHRPHVGSKEVPINSLAHLF
jgi:hypothetical protein